MELDALLQYATELQKTLQGIDSAMPDHGEATDRSGAVRVILGARGLPERFRVATDWNRKITPHTLGEAVAEACEAALQKRMAAWGKVLEDQGLIDQMKRIDRLEAQADVAPTNLPDDSLPPAFQRKPEGFRAPPLDLLADRALSAQDSLDSFLASNVEDAGREPQGTGSDRARTLQLTVSESGSVTCVVDPKWAARRSGAQVTEALNNVLSAALRDLFAALDATRSTVPGVDITELTEMIAEAGAVVYRPTRKK